MHQAHDHPNWWVYIVECSDGTYYTGITYDIDQRIKKHNSGRGATYTRARTPVQLIYSEQYSSHMEAARREFEIKKLKRNEKQLLIKKHHLHEEI
jgi:putative endonuclease